MLHNWCNKSRGMCCPVCRKVHTKEQVLLIGKNSSCSGRSGFPLLLTELSFTICPMPYNRKIQNVLSASLNKTFPSSFLGLIPTLNTFEIIITPKPFRDMVSDSVLEP